MTEETRIILRACVVEITGEDVSPGVVLPDGRILAWDKNGARVSSYRDRDALMSEHPGAKLHMHPDADAIMNNQGVLHS
jgi:hypothetical protein